VNKKSYTLSDDGLITPSIGPWGEHKYRLVSNYARIFAKSMKMKWHCRVYLDLFAGAGRSRIEGTSRIVRASPLLAVDISDRFDRYIFCEKDSAKISTLKKRVQRDYPDIDAFCFADPYNMGSLYFHTLEQLAERFMDFLILIPSGMDANRNLNPHYLKPENKTIDMFLGDSTWRAIWQKVQFNQSFDVFLTNSYGQKMEGLGYHYRGIGSTQLIRSREKNLPLYRLAFFSRHSLGEEFWKETKRCSDPQLKLFGYTK
jgi:hypothetical protein